MDTLTRRRFLIASGVTGAAALAAGAALATPLDLQNLADRAPLAESDKILVLVTLYGGNDGLSAVIPSSGPDHSAYQDARPDLAYDASEVIRLDGELGLNPSMKGLGTLWQAKQLAVVRGVGYPTPDFSHFRSMDIWQTASPSSPVTTGWIGRWLDATGDDPVRALNIGSVLPPAAVGARSTAAALDASGDTQLRPADAAAVTGLGRAQTGDTPAAATVSTSYRDERIVAKTFTPVLGVSSSTSDTGAASGGHSGQSADDLGAQLDFVGRCVKAGVPTRVYLVSLGGFDTHADERATQQRLLAAFDAAVSGFLKDMAGDANGRKVVLTAYSEFGRRVAANASDGTDHGTAGPMFVAGVPVRGGFYGDQPSLTDLDDGNLKATVDFRAVYGELLGGVLGSDPAQVLDTVPHELGFLA